MLKKRFLLFLLVISFVSLNVGAYSISTSSVNSTYENVDITGALDAYGYEINFDITGNIDEIDQSNFLGPTAVATYGSSERDSILSVYGSQLNDTGEGVDGNGELFNISYSSGTVTLRYALIVHANGTESYVYYNNTVDSGSGDSGGGGGGGGGVATSSGVDFSVEPDLVSIELKQGETKRITLSVTNNDDSVLSIDSITSVSIERFLKISEATFSVAAGQSKQIIVDVIAAEDEVVDSHLGKIVISGGGLEKEINFAIDVKGKSPLFDVIVGVDETVNPGEQVMASIEILNLGDLKGGIDVLLYYAVRDFDGNVIAEASESLAIETRIAVVRRLRIPDDLAHGKYILYARASYEDVQATATKAFDVGSRPGFAPLFGEGGIPYLLMVLVFVGVVGIIIVLIGLKSSLNKRKQKKFLKSEVAAKPVVEKAPGKVYIGGE